MDLSCVLCAGLVVGKRVFRLRAADEISPELWHLAVFRQIHSSCKAQGWQEVLGMSFGPDYLCRV